jgi:hypothetical protein
MILGPEKYQFRRNSYYSDVGNQGFAKFAKIIHALELGKVSKKSKPVDWFFSN